MFRIYRYAGARLRKFAGEMPYLPRALALVCRAAPRLTAAWVALLLIQAVVPVVGVYLTRSLVNRLLPAIVSRGDYRALVPALSVLALLAAALIFGELLRGLSDWVRTAQAELVRDHICQLVYQKSTLLDLDNYDQPEFYDRLERARADSLQAPVLLLENAGAILQNGITLLAMAAVLAPYGLWLPLALLLATIPALYATLRSGMQLYEWRRRTTGDERRLWYYDWLLTSRECAQEIRLFDLGECFRLARQALRIRLRNENLGFARQRSVLEFAAALLGFLVMGLSLGWIIWRVALGKGTLGDVALFYQAFNQGLGLMRVLLENLGRAYTNTLSLRNVFEFLALQPRILSSPTPLAVPARLRSGVFFREVSFAYPGTERSTLRKLDLFLPAGKIAAIVGRNGAGKSTLLKLLCRFYDPDEGVIEWDGVDLRQFSVPALRQSISALFQEPVHYAATAMQNICISSPSGLKQCDLDRAVAAAEAQQVMARLPDGYQSMLGTCLEQGSQLSVGEWQRIALARGLYRSTPILVLDEPTSAMDPWTESEWGSRLREIAAGRTTMLITHRLTTAAFADIIYVFDEGKVVQHGSHEELMTLSGPYARVWPTHDGPRMSVASTPFPPELKLLLACAQSQGKPKTEQQIRALLEAGINWPETFILADHHGLTPFLWWRLGAPAILSAAHTV